jgi:hypothetical protein
MEAPLHSTVSMPANCTLEEYLAYLYLSIANADMEISDLELQVIEARLTPLLRQYFPKLQVDMQFLLKNLRRVVVCGSEMDRIRIIEELNKKYTLSKELQETVLSDLHDLVNVDDRVAFSEYAMMHYIRACFAE